VVEIDGIRHDPPNIIQRVFDHFLRVRKDRLLAPIARRLGRRVSPTAITALAFIVGLAAAYGAATRASGLALGCWLANRLLDGFDGTLARVTNTATELGAYLDIVLDFVVYAAIPIGLAIASPDPRAPLAAILLLASFYVNAATWMALSATPDQSPPGLITGAETVVFYSLFLALPDQLVVLFRVMTVLVALTALQRIVWAVRHLPR
jgi:phosphatidylglycerophosphate synthase